MSGFSTGPSAWKSTVAVSPLDVRKWFRIHFALYGETAPILAASSDLHYIDVVLLIDLGGQPFFDA
jgi:hypothetical protein